jgi:hypothetical protein
MAFTRREFLVSSAALAAGLASVDDQTRAQATTPAAQALDADAVFARTFVFDAL